MPLTNLFSCAILASSGNDPGLTKGRGTNEKDYCFAIWDDHGFIGLSTCGNVVTGFNTIAKGIGDVNERLDDGYYSVVILSIGDLFSGDEHFLRKASGILLWGGGGGDRRNLSF